MTQPLETPRRRYTVQEYFALERAATTRHQFIDGEILDMVGGTYIHDRISTNIVSEAHQRLKGSTCSVNSSDLRIRYGNSNKYGYADGLIFCGEPQFDPLDSNTLINPLVVVEVVSDSTEAYDRGDKFSRYRELESFKEYVLVSQKSPMVEVYTRQDDGSWTFNVYQGLESRVQLRSVNIELPMNEIYAGVTFAPAPEAAAG